MQNVFFYPWSRKFVHNRIVHCLVIYWFVKVVSLINLEESVYKKSCMLFRINCLTIVGLHFYFVKFLWPVTWGNEHYKHTYSIACKCMILIIRHSITQLIALSELCFFHVIYVRKPNLNPLIICSCWTTFNKYPLIPEVV